MKKNKEKNEEIQKAAPEKKKSRSSKRKALASESSIP